MKLVDPLHSPKNDKGNCEGGDICAANKAIDGDFTTRSVTGPEPKSWWEAMFKKTILITQFHIFIPKAAHEKGFYDRLIILLFEGKG